MICLFIAFPNAGYTFKTELNIEKKIGINQIVAHPALDAVREGMIAALKEEGFEEGKNISILCENAQGNLVTSTQVATKLLSMPLDAIVTISTPSAQSTLYAAKRLGKRIPLVFSAVNDPISAKLEAGENDYPITGVTDAPNIEAMLQLIKKLLPNLKTLGVLYNSSEQNSISTVKLLKEKAAFQNILIKEVTVNSSSDVPQALQSIKRDVDALYFPQDNTIVSAIETVVSIANQSNQDVKALPLFCSDPLLIDKGVLAAVGYDYKEIGKEAGKMVVRLLKGENIKNIPIYNSSKIMTVINKPLAKEWQLNY